MVVFGSTWVHLDCFTGYMLFFTSISISNSIFKAKNHLVFSFCLYYNLNMKSYDFSCTSSITNSHPNSCFHIKFTWKRTSCEGLGSNNNPGKGYCLHNVFFYVWQRNRKCIKVELLRVINFTIVIHLSFHSRKRG